MAFGLSDHNQSMYQALLLRYVYGGTVYEKHFSSPNCTSLDRDVSIHSWQAREYVRQLRLSNQVQTSMRDDCISDKTHIFASSFYLDRDVKAGDNFVLSHCRRLRDGKVASMNTKSFWTSYRSNYSYRYSRDLPRGARIEEGDLV
jgi:sialic acid synthase SpsE